MMNATKTNLNQLTETEEKVAEDLFNAYETKKPLKMSDYNQLVTNTDSAYRVQNRLMELKNQSLGGYKVSLTSKKTQDMFNSKEPLYGAQVQSHFVESGTNLALGENLMDPLAEVELVFKAKEDLSTDDSMMELARKTTVAPGVEVPDSRFKDWFPDLSKYLVMSDAAVGGYVVYGAEHETNDYKLKELANVHCHLFHDEKELGEGVSSEVLGNPMRSLKWLVDKLSQQGKALKAGQRVSSGTFLLPPHLTHGKWKATFDNNMNTVHFNVK